MDEQQWIANLLKENDRDAKLTEKQIKILKAAVETFAEKGYASTSTSEIAKKAGVAEGTIFRHYKTKKDLLLAIVIPTLTKVIVPTVAKEFAKDVFENQYESYEDFLRALIKNRYHFIKKNLPLVRIFWQEFAFHPEIKEEFQKAFTENVYQRFKEMVEQFQEKGEIVELPTASIIRMTITTIGGFFLTRFVIMPEHEWDDEVEIERTIQFLMNGLRKR
ncbi:TetR/AcrR family transcriptional regulator [Thermolongibacillus altinsuensis]|uniref:TetR/AcrR family transcriptional regulator n=1 Tax=Thermolongibacillus altinsuensis TaxID=575256 RepID=UPI00242A3072|nr:TetR/AcrR family transcriptional regulator [Thermolongibacillus altinsuensis]GMB09246.1 TetR family transcriptional regulator [Thermolongibacillus altinsuensis]